MSIVDPVSQPFPDYSLPPAPAESLVRFTVEQYHDMARQGFFADDERVELLEGLLVRKMTISPAHHLATARVQDVLRKHIPPGYFVASPASVTFATSEPEPDAMVVRGRAKTTPSAIQARRGHAGRRSFGQFPAPGPAFQKAIYAKALIPVYWIVNLIDRQIEVYSQPTGPVERPDYSDHQDYAETKEVPLVIDGREIASISVREVLA